MDNHVYIIAEAGVNHNGKLDLALRLCDVAKEAGVDAVKFQTWKTENIVTKTAELASYQENNISNKDKSQFQMLKDLELSFSDFEKINTYCRKIGIQFLSTASEKESLEFILALGVPFIKLGSGDINNIPHLRMIGSYHKDVILSTGMSYLSDVDLSYRTLIESGAKSVSLLHCTTNYPCPYDEVNLQAMQTLREAFKCRVGYSDHTMGIEIPTAAVAMGAQIIEKHFTLDRTMDGPDHKASLEPLELKAMVDSIRNVERALGNGIKRPNVSELKISQVVLKRIVAAKEINAGDVLSSENLTYKRSSEGLSTIYWDIVCGSISDRHYNIDDPIIL